MKTTGHILILCQQASAFLPGELAALFNRKPRHARLATTFTTLVALYRLL
jgi:hypothetical protein